MADPERHYMQTPLALWVETFKANDGHPLEYQDLYDGVFLNDVMQQINPRQEYDGVNRCVEDVTTRLHNWDVLVKNIRGYYRDVLQQMLVVRLPNYGAICREPDKDSSYNEIRKTLLLILGCAVQCEQKEAFIDKIMAMGIEAQTEIVENIKEITDDCESILPTQIPDTHQGVKSYVDKMFHHLHRLIQERDDLAELSYDACQERDFYQTQVEGKPVIDTPQMSPEKHHVALELAECKAKLRHLRQELELYQEQLSDARDELKQATANCCHLKNENASLLQEARATRSLRDELDVLKEKTSKVDMFEKEILKYKERLNELEFYKARTEELKEDNSILEETKAMLEDQLSNSRKRIETVVEMEAEVTRYRQLMEEMNREREIEKEKLEYLTEENARLEFAKKSSMHESVSLESELSAARSRIGSMGGSLSDQLSETSHARILRLELENQRLSAKLAEMKEESLIQSAEISLELEKENQRLTKRMEKLQTSACESSEQVVQMESEMSSVREEKERLVKALDAVKENADRQVGELERENEQLARTLDSIRARSEKTNDAKVKDLERENRILHETVSSKNTQLGKLEFDTRQMQRTMVQLQDSVDRIQALEEESQKLEKENTELYTKVSALQHSTETLEAIEQENSDLAVECRKLQKTVESLQSANQRREQLEQDHIALKVDHQRLQRSLESFKVESERVVELETEKDGLRKELQQLQKSLEGQKTQKLKQEQMEFEVIDLGHENQKLQKSLEVTTRRLQQLEKDNNDLEMEGEKMGKELESLRLTAKRMEGRQEDLTRLETEVTGLARDKNTLGKENRKLKQNAELKDSSLEELNAKFSSLDQESKSLRQSVDKMKEACARVKEVERDNKGLLQDLNTDRRTLATLREELVSEKIRAQESMNQMEQLKAELERVGINTEKLQMAEQVNDANRYKALETMIEETLKKSNELKEEKIQALESRLEESKKRNSRQQEDLRLTRTEMEVLKQRMEEDIDVMRVSTQNVVGASPGAMDSNRERERLTRSGDSSGHSNKEVQDLKDRRIELERMNATLLAENKNLSGSNQALSKQCNDLEAQLTQLLTQNSSLQGNNSSLQERVAKLQVENTTMQSQSLSAIAQQDLLKEQFSRLESDHESLGQSHDSLRSTHHSLVLDHESLQRLHQQLTSDYEKLLVEHSSHKALQKSLKTELKNLQEQLNVLLQSKDDVNRLRQTLEQEKEQLKRELHALGNLQTDHQRLKEDHNQMGRAYDKLSQDYSNVLASHKQIKTDYNNLQRRATEQEGNISEAKENLTTADMEFQKLENKIDAMYQINERLENENQALLLQIQQLLNQNQDLLTQALNSKDHFAEEEKSYLEKLSELRRQKERLEEKIMDHYRNRISPKKKGLGALIARKAKGIISRAPRRSKSRNNLNEGQDNSSQGSAEISGESGRKHGPDGIESTTMRRSKSSGDGLSYAGSSPKLANQNRSLAKSYTALHSPVFENEQVSQLRGAKSTEDLNEVIAGDSNCLPGVGRPYNFEDGDHSPKGRRSRSTTPGLSGRRTPGRSSPGSEMLTLGQFLVEANKSSPRGGEEGKSDESGNRRKSHDSESRSSDNSNNSSNRTQQQQQHQHPNLTTTSSSSFMLSPASVRDLSTSRNSRLSTGSGNDNSSLGSTGALAGGGEIFITSTPKSEQELLSSVIMRERENQNRSSSFDSNRQSSVDNDLDIPHASQYLNHRRRSGDDYRSSSQESSPYTSSNRVNATPSAFPPHSSSSPRAPSSLASSSTSLNNPQQQPPIQSSHSISHSQSQPLYNNNNFNNNNSNNNSNQLHHNQQPPPIPSEPPPPITATERLDRLTMLAAASPPSSSNPYDQPTASVRNNIERYNTLMGSSNNSNYSSKDQPNTRTLPDSDRRRSQGSSMERLKGMPSQLQPPIPRSQPGTGKQNSLDNSIVSGHNPNRPPSAQALTGPTTNIPPAQRARPASVMGPSRHVRGVISRPPGGERRQQTQGGSPNNSNDIILRRNANAANNHSQDGSSNSQSISERPKSVPPHLFNKPDEYGNTTGVARRDNRDGREMPVPPPRRTQRDSLMRNDNTIGNINNNPQGREEPDGREPMISDSTHNPVQRQPTPVTLIREPSRRGSRPFDPLHFSQTSQPSNRPPSSASLSSHPTQQQSLQQQPPSLSPSLSNSRQSSSSSLSSSHNQQQPYPIIAPTSSNNRQIRPDSLPLRGSHMVGGSHPHASDNVSANSATYRPPSTNTTIPRSQSSIGQPMSHNQQQQQQHQQSRSNTPGPHPARRNYAATQSQSLDGPAGNIQSGRQDLNSNYNHHHQPHPSSSQRGGSEPRDLSSSSSIHHPQSHNASYPSDTIHSHPHPSHPSSSTNTTPRSHSQGPPPNRSHHPLQNPNHAGYSSSSSSNGPLSPDSSHYTTPHPINHTNPPPPPSHSTAPQIRSQGKLPPQQSSSSSLSNHYHHHNHPDSNSNLQQHSNININGPGSNNTNPITSTTPRQQTSNSVSALRSPGEVMAQGQGQSRSSMGLPTSALPDAGSPPNQMKPQQQQSSQQADGEGEGGAGQPPPPAKGDLDGHDL